MNHDEYKEKLSALLDGELNDAERADVLAHLDTCEACQTYFAELNAMRDALGDLEPVDVPDGFAAGVMMRLHEEDKPQKTRIRSPWRTWGTLAACAAVVVLAVATVPNMFRMGGASSSDSSAPAAAPPEALMNTASAPSGGSDTDGFAADEDALEADLYRTEIAEAPAEASADSANGTLDTYDARSGDAAAENTPAEPTSEEKEDATGEPPVVTIYGGGAYAWLPEHGVWSEADGGYLVSAAALRALPEDVVLGDADAALVAELPDEAEVVVWYAEPEVEP